MRRILFSILLGLLAFTGNSQNKKQEILVKYDANISGVLEKIEVRANWEASQSITNPSRNLELYQRSTYRLNCTNVFRNYQKNTQWYKELQGQVLIKDELNQFQWQLHNQQDSVLGYLCRKATASYRGRDYIAWFTIEIPFKAAPWKMHALPGVVLKVNTTDEMLDINAKILKIQEGSGEIQNPYRLKKYVSWNEFKTRYVIQMIKEAEMALARHEKYNINAEGISDLKIEIIVKHNRSIIPIEEAIQTCKEYLKKNGGDS